MHSERYRLRRRMLHVHLWHCNFMHSQIAFKNANNPDGYVIGQLYKLHKYIKGSAFFSLRYQNIHHQEGDTMIVLDIKVNEDHPTKPPWKDVHVLINGQVGSFTISAFQDLIDTQSIKLVK